MITYSIVQCVRNQFNTDSLEEEAICEVVLVRAQTTVFQASSLLYIEVHFHALLNNTNIRKTIGFVPSMSLTRALLSPPLLQSSLGPDTEAYAKSWFGASLQAYLYAGLFKSETKDEIESAHQGDSNEIEVIS